jgi:hypothetical protein
VTFEGAGCFVLRVETTNDALIVQRVTMLRLSTTLVRPSKALLEWRSQDYVRSGRVGTAEFLAKELNVPGTEVTFENCREAPVRKTGRRRE